VKQLSTHQKSFVRSLVTMKTTLAVFVALALVSLCHCQAEETQEKTQEESLPQLQAGWDSAEDSDDCRDRLCNGRGRCYNRGRSCRCYAGYSGAFCQTATGPCRLNPCLNGGFCYNSASAFTCRCRYGWTGRRCELRY